MTGSNVVVYKLLSNQRYASGTARPKSTRQYDTSFATSCRPSSIMSSNGWSEQLLGSVVPEDERGSEIHADVNGTPTQRTSFNQRLKNTDLIDPVSSHNAGHLSGNTWGYPHTALLTNRSDDTSFLSMPSTCVDLTDPRNITYRNHPLEVSQPVINPMTRSDSVMKRYEFRAPGVFYTVPMAPQQRKQLFPRYATKTRHEFNGLSSVPTWDETQIPLYQYPQSAFSDLRLDGMGSASVAGPSCPRPPPTWDQNTQQPSTPSSKLLSADAMNHEKDPETVIGSVLKNGRLTCSNPLCTGKSFGRQAELNRHYDTTHAAYKPEFWCPVTTCRRSACLGIRSFPRIDKLKSHIESVHGSEVADSFL
jgi:hypothetical protein